MLDETQHHGLVPDGVTTWLSPGEAVLLLMSRSQPFSLLFLKILTGCRDIN